MKNALSIVARSLALLGLALLSVGALAAATTGPARAQSLGTLTLNPNSGSVTDNPMTTATTSGGCPTGFQGLARLAVRPAGTTENGRNLAGLFSGNLTASFSVAANRSLQTALTAPPAAGNYEVFVQCFDAFGIAASPDVFSTAVVVSGTTWQGPAQATTTSLAVSPEESPQPVGTDVTLTATVAPTSAAGTVEFFDSGTTSLGTAAVTAGTASLTLTDPVAATYSFTAVFTPADAAFEPSTSDPVPYQISDPEAQDTQTDLAVSPPSPQPVGTPVTLTATVDPPSAAGTVEFRNGSAALGSRTTSSGAATLAVNNLPVGTHSLRAVFVPADQGAFNGSESAAASYQITGVPVETETTLAVEPDGPVPQGTEVTLTATVEPLEAEGTVELRDGETALGSAPVTNGTAIFETTALAGGEHTLTAAFTAEDEDAFAASTSAPVTYEVGPPEQDPDLTVTDAGGNELEANPTLEPGQTVNITARNFEGDEAVEVTLDDAEFDALTAGSDGVVETEFTVPENTENGAHQLAFAGAEQEVVFDFVADAGDDPPGDDPPGKGGGLPLTGMSLAMVAGSGIALTGGGTGLMLLTRRRRSAQPAADAQAAEAVEQEAP